MGRGSACNSGLSLCLCPLLMVPRPGQGSERSRTGLGAVTSLQGPAPRGPRARLLPLWVSVLPWPRACSCPLCTSPKDSPGPGARGAVACRAHHSGSRGRASSPTQHADSDLGSSRPLGRQTATLGERRGAMARVLAPCASGRSSLGAGAGGGRAAGPRPALWASVSSCVRGELVPKKAGLGC